MNKHDLILIIIVLIVGGFMFLIPHLFNSNSATKANVYYDNKLVLTVDLSTDQVKDYTVKGYNGNVVIETAKNKIRVKQEKSPLHLCSKQGWISSSLESIVCLPNKIIIKIEATNSQIDAVVR